MDFILSYLLAGGVVVLGVCMRIDNLGSHERRDYFADHFGEVVTQLGIGR